MTTTEDERTNAIQHYFNELLKNPDVVWESISETACRSDEEAAKRALEIADAIKLQGYYKTLGILLPGRLAVIVMSAYDYITALATARYDAEGAPEELQQ